MAANINKSERIAIFGGSFDPIHLGHLHIAKQVLEMHAAREVWFIPSGKHRFKQDTIVLDYDSRFALIHRTLQAEPDMKVLDLDKAGVGDGSTYDMMLRLMQAYPGQEFTCLIGMDNLPQLPNWQNFAWLKDNVRFLIAVRPGFKADATVISQIENFNYLNCKPIEISSTDIRQRIVSGQGIQGLVAHQLLVDITRMYKLILK